MPSATNTVLIRKPVSDVFAFLADGATATSWRSGVLDIGLVSGSGVGATYRQGVRGPGGRRVAADYEVTAYEPGSRLAFRTIVGPVRPTGEFVLAAVRDATRLTFTLQAELPFFRRFLMGRAVQLAMDAEVAALPTLKLAVESKRP